MAGLNWNLAPRGVDALQILQDAGKLSQQRIDQQQAMRSSQARQQVSGALQTGNVQQAQQAAYASGDPDLIKAVAGMQDDQRKQLSAQAKVTAQAAAGLRQIPAAQRAQAFQSYVPALLQNGLTQEEIRHAAQDLSDGTLDGYINTARSISETVDAYAPKWQSIGEGGIVNVRDPAAIAAYQAGGAPQPPAQQAPQNAATLEAQAQAAIAAGADPVAVRARMQQMQGGAGSQAQRGFP